MDKIVALSFSGKRNIANRMDSIPINDNNSILIAYKSKFLSVLLDDKFSWDDQPILFFLEAPY